MADFKPSAYREYVYDSDGSAYRLVGWNSPSGCWVDMEPVVPNPDGPGVQPWSTHHGTDPWYFPQS